MGTPMTKVCQRDKRPSFLRGKLKVSEKKTDNGIPVNAYICIYYLDMRTAGAK